MVIESSNHGEGDPEAAERFNTAEQDFVNSPRGKQKIQEGPRVKPGEEAELAKAERWARSTRRIDATAPRRSAIQAAAREGASANTVPIGDRR